MKDLPSLKIVLRQKKARGIPLVWNFYTDIPSLQIIASPRTNKWLDRVKEEIRVFETWRLFNANVPFKNLRIAKNNPQRFLVDVNVGELFNMGREYWLTVTINVPISYPKHPPTIGDPRWDREFIMMLRKWTNYKPFCMPPVFRAWWFNFKGKAGIAHFLQAFMVFLAVAGKSNFKKKDFIIYH
ncbi:MAG: hypothetical protein ACTSX9_02110 [Candidatus Njordarchaeales archaeon]